jgi:hypothetical protein
MCIIYGSEKGTGRLYDLLGRDLQECFKLSLNLTVWVNDIMSLQFAIANLSNVNKPIQKSIYFVSAKRADSC